jgi:hypothetical protein
MESIEDIESYPICYNTAIKESEPDTNSMLLTPEGVIKQLFPQRMKTDIILNMAVRNRLITNITTISSRIGDAYPCILWLGSTNGRITVCGKYMRCVRFVYEYCIGDLDKGSIIRQICPRDHECLQYRHLKKFDIVSTTNVKSIKTQIYANTRNENRIKRRRKHQLIVKTTKTRLKNGLRFNEMKTILQ